MALVAAVAFSCWPAVATVLGQDDGATVFENERVVISRLRAGARERSAAGARRSGLLISLADGAVRTTDETLDFPTPREGAVLVELKDARVAPLTVPRGVARAFPRQGVKRVIENDRLVVWDLTWQTGMKTAIHFHDKDVVAVYLGAGTVRSIPVDGEPTATARRAGDAVFLPRGRTHIEECIAGPRRDIIIELK
jgi:hypothetical protein